MLSADGFAAGVGVAVAEAGARIELLAQADDFQTDALAIVDEFGGSDEPIAMADETIEATWIDADGGDWNDSANWQDGHVPVAGDDVVIAGLNEGASISLSGDTAALASLSIDGATVTISGTLSTVDLDVSNGGVLHLQSGASTITGNVTFAAGTSFELQSGASLTWSGATWDQGGFAHVTASTTFTQTSGVLSTSASSQFAISESYVMTGGELVVNAGGVNLYHDSSLQVTDATVTLNNGTLSAYNESVVTFTNSVLQGSGTYRLNQQLNFVDSTLRPGGADTAGSIDFVYGEDNVSGTFNFSGAWAIELEVFDASSVDTVSIQAAVAFGASGAIDLDASAADFGDTAHETSLGNLLTVTGAGVTGGAPTVQITAGADDTVTAAWSDDALTVQTYSPLVATWINAAGGDWSDTANWANGRLPNAGASVAITGLNSDAVITVDGLALALGDLSLDAGTLSLSNSAYLAIGTGGSLSLSGLSLVGSTVTLSGNATATTSGDVTVDTSSRIEVQDTAHWQQMGGTWNLNGAAYLRLSTSARFTQSDGLFASNDTSVLRVEDASTWTFSGGEYRLVAAASAEWFDTAALVINGGTLNLLESGAHLRAAAAIDFSAGTLTGQGLLTANGGITIAGAVAPTGALRIAGGQAITFTGAWSVTLDILATDDFDSLSLTGTVTFGGTGVITLDASAADFSGIDEGTAIDDLVVITGSISGDPAAVNVTAGTEFSVAADWDGTTFNVTTIGGVPAETTADVVNAGLSAASTTVQGLVNNFDLSTSTLAVPTLPTALDDLFELGALSASLALPTISGATDLASTIAALQSAGYTVDTSVAGTDFVATFTRTVATDRTQASAFDTAWVQPADLFAGFADNASLTAVLNLAASLVQHVVFELRDGVFNLLADTYLALAMAGGATLSGSVRQGGRTVAATGSSTVDVEVRVHHGADGAAVTGEGTVDTSFALTSGPLELIYARDYGLSRDLTIFLTTIDSTPTLNAQLSLAEVAGGDLDLVGTLAGDGQSWTLAGTGSSISWLGFDVADWSFSVDLSSTTFNGSGSFDTALDILSNAGVTPAVSFGATFDQEELTFTGTLSDDLIAVANPAGGTYLSIADFSASVSVIGDLDAGTWSGSLTFSGGETTVGPDGAAFTATITDGDDADTVAVTGSYDFATQTFTTTADQFEMVAETVVRATAAGVVLRHQRDVTDEQELVKVDEVTVELLFLTSAPSTGPPSLTAADLSIRTNGITIGAGSLTNLNLQIGSVLTVGGASVSFAGFSFLDGNLSGDSVTLAADSATLFADSTVFTATATGLSGTYDFGSATDRLTLSADALALAVGDLITFTAADLTLRPEGATVFAAASIGAELPDLGVSGTISGLELSAAGELTVTALTLDTSEFTKTLRLGGLLPFTFDGLQVDFLGDTNDNGVRDAGETFALNEFDLTVAGTFDFTILAGLPFTPVIRVGEQAVDDGADAVAFTLRHSAGDWTPWDVGPIELGVSDLHIGESFTFAGSIMLGGYENGVWVADFGGSLTVSAGTSTSDLVGEFTTTITGSLDVDTGVLTVGASFDLDFKVGSYVSVTDALINFAMTIVTVDAESGDGFTLDDTVLEVQSASIGSLAVTFGDLLDLEATEAVFDFNATGSDPFLSVGSLTATLRGVGLTGTASNFAVGANGLPLPLEDFKVSFSFTTATLGAIQWPDWLPIEVSVFELQWPDLLADPLDFTLRLSAAINVSSLAGSNLTLDGSIQNLVIDVGALKSGAFPIVGLGEIAIAVGGKISSAEVSAGLILGLLRLDADGNAIASDDTTTAVADGLLWGAVQGSINIAGYGGLEVYLGLSEYGPLQGYIKATVPVTIPYVGIAFTDFRAGITFNSAMESVDDPLELKENPSFKPAGDLSFVQWKALIESSLANQVAAHAEAGNFGVLLNPFTIEGGVTIFSIYASTATFNIQADFKMDSTGKFLARGAFQLGGSISFTASLYIDMSGFITEGEGTVLFLATVPAELPVASIYGALTFDFGETIDPDNPPEAPFEQFTIRLLGGAELAIAGLPGFTIEGEIAFEVALNAPSLHITTSGRVALPHLGDVIGLAGDMRLFFADDGTVAAEGIMALTPADFALLEPIGVTLDAIALLRFNTTGEAVEHTLTIPGQTEPRTFTLAAGEASILVEGVMGLAPGGVELFRLGGVFSMTFSTNGFDVLASAVLTAGPTTAPLLRFDAQGYLHLEVDGILPGMAAQFVLNLDPNDDVLAAIGVELEGHYEFIMNTTGDDVDFALPTELAATAAVERIHLPRGPPSADGETVGAAGPYLIVRAEGTLNLLDLVDLEGVFDFQVADGQVQLDYEAKVRLGVGAVTFYEYDAQGVFRLDASGIYGQADLVINASIGLPALALGFSFDATYQLQVNTTNADQTLGDVTLAAGHYARVRADGALIVGAWRFVGTYDLFAGVDGVSATAAGSVSLGIGDVEFASFDFAGTLLIRDDGIFAQLALAQSRSAPTVYGFGFSADASYELSLNTTQEEIDGVAAGLGARIVVTGALEIGNWQIDGVYTLNATTTGIGFAASAALIFKAGDDELFRVPLDFEIELELPGIIEQIDLSLSLEDLGINIPGLKLSGSAQILINTTGEQQGDIPPGPILRFNIDGQAVIGGLALDGTFGFESTLGGVTMFGGFAANLGPAGDPLLSFTGSGEFELTLLGVAGYADLALTGGVDTFRDFFNADFSFFITANTRPVPYTLGERELPAGPTVKIGATGSLDVLGYSFSGSYTLAAGGAGVDLTMDATASVDLGDFTLMSFTAVGGLHLGLDGLVAAFDVTPDVVDFAAVGLSLNTDANFALRINTTGERQTVGEIELAAGHYARVTFTTSLTYGIFHFDGLFSLSVVDNTAELLVDSELIAALPGIGGADPVELFRLNAQGGIRIAPEGVVAAIELDRGALDQLTLLDVRLPIGVSQDFVLHLNTTGEAATLGEVELAAGRYAKIVTTGEIEVGPVRISGLYTLSAGETGLEMAFDADVFLGVPATEISLMRWHAQGGFQIKANGVAGAFQLEAAAGLAGLDTIGLDIETIGQDVLRLFRINTTGEEIVIGDVTLEAGHYIEVVLHDAFSIGLARILGTATFRLGGDGLLIDAHGEVFFGLPGVAGQDDVGFKFNVDAEFAIVGDGIYGRAAIEPGLQPLTVAGVNFTPDVAVGPVFTVNTTGTDKMVDGDTIRAGSINLAVRVEVSLFEQSANFGAVFTIDFERQIIAAIVQGRIALSVGEWTPYSYNATGIVLIAAEGVAVDLSLALDAGDGIPGVSANLDWGLRASTFAGPTTIEGFTIGQVIVPTLVFDSGGVYRVGGAGTLEIGGLLLDGSFFFEVTDGPELFDVTLTVTFDATVKLEVGDTMLLEFATAGGLSVSVDGIWGGIDLTLPASGLDTAALGFALEATYRLEINTTGAAQTVGQLELPAGPYARVQIAGDLLVGALRMSGAHGFAVGADGVRIDSVGSVALAVAGITFYEYDYAGEFLLDASGLYASLSLTVGSTNRDQFGFGFSADATYTLGINTTHTEQDGVPPGLGARVRVAGNLEIGDISMAGVYDLTATTTGIGFAASAALVLRSDDTVLLEVPVDFSYELEIPGIVDEIALDLAAEDLGIDIPGLDFAGEAAIVINTTGVAQGDIPAGPLLQLAVNGTATVGAIDLNGRFAFESSLNRTRMITSFTYHLGDENAPLLSYSATGAFNLGLDGIAGIFDLELTGGDAAIREHLGTDLTYQLVVNTTASEYQLFDQTLPAGPLYQIEAHGDIDLGGLTSSGDYIFRIDGTGLLLEVESEIDVAIPAFGGGDDLLLFGFEVDGGLAINRDGIATALDLVPTFASLDAFGLTIGPEAVYRLAVNTTGGSYTFGDVELEAGVYGRFELSGSMSFGIATMTGLFRFEADTAGAFEMQGISELELNVPGLGELARFSYSGGFRFDSTGVIGSADLERSAASERIEVGGVTLPFKAEQSFLLRLNTTNQAREIGGVELEAGHYFAIDTVGEIDFGIARSGGPMSLVVEGHNLDIELDQEVWVGIPGTELALYNATMTGALHLGSDGIWAAIDMRRQVGADAAAALGLDFGPIGAEETIQLSLNSTGTEQQAGEVTLRAGTYIEVLRAGSIGVGVAAMTGDQRFYAGEAGVIFENTGTVSVGLPASGDFDGFTLFEANVVADMVITGDGVWGAYSVTRSTESIAVAGISLTPDFDAGITMALNTTSTVREAGGVTIAADSLRIAGRMSFDFLGAQLSGQSVLTVDWEQGYGAIAFDGNVAIGIGDWRPFSYDASGFILIGEAGAVTNLDLTLNGGTGVAGISFEGDWALRASTMSEGVTVAPFTVGDIDVPEISIEAGNLLRTHMSGSVTALGGLTLAGDFDLSANSVEFTMASSGTVDFFGVTSSYTGNMYIHPERGMVANMAMEWGGIDNAFMAYEGDVFLRINTWDGVWEDVAPNTFEVGVDHGALRLGFTELTGSGAFRWADGEAQLWVDMDSTLLPGMDGHFDGFITSAGAYNLNGSFTLALGDRDLAGAFGTLQANLNNTTGLTGTVSGDLYVPGGDYGRLAGSFAMTSDEARLTIDETAFVMLGGTVRIDAGFEAALREGVFSIAVDQAQLTLRVPGMEQTATVSGHINSLGVFDLQGTMAVDLGNETLGADGSIELRVSNSGISGAIAGSLYVPGDYGSYSGTFAADANGYEIAASSRFVLLGGIVLFDGSFNLVHTTERLRLTVEEMTAESRVPGLGSTFAIHGYIDGSGEFELTGSTSFTIGNRTVGAEVEVEVSITDQGFAGAYSGSIFVPGDYGSFSGSLTADASGFDLDGTSRFVLLGGIVLLDGNLNIWQRNGVLEIAINRMTATSRIPGWDSSFTLDGYVNSNGTFDLTGTAALDVGNSVLGLEADISLRVRNDGISGEVSGTLYVPGDYAGFNGSFEAGAWGFSVTASSRFVLLGGAVLLDGGMLIEMRSGVMTVAFDNILIETRVPGWSTTFRVDGYLRSDGDFYLTGSTSLAIGDDTLGATATLDVVVRDEGIAADADGRLTVPGDYADFSGSFRADLDGFDLEVSSRFALLEGLVILDGGLGISYRGSLLRFDFDSIRAESGIPGLGTEFTVDGYIRSDGDFYLAGRSDLQVGDTVLGAEATVDVVIRDEGVFGALNGRLYIPGDFADFSGSFEAGAWGFNLTIDQIRFVLLGGLVLLDGSMLMEQRGSDLRLYIENMTAELRLPGFNQTFGIRGSFNTAGGFDLTGTARLDIGSSHIGATGDLEITIDDLGIRGSIRGTVYVPGDYAGYNGTFSANAEGWSVSIDRVRFVLLSGNFLVDGSLELLSRDGGLYISLPRASVYLWGIDGHISGYFDSTTGHWRADGEVGFRFGSDIGAWGHIEFDIGHDRANAHVTGKAWAEKDYWLFGWRTYSDWARIDGSIDLFDGRLDVRMKFWKFTITVHVRLKGGFRVWLSNVGGSTVFLDVNRNGVLDEGEPSTQTDANGNFDFAEQYDPEAEGDTPLEGEAPEVASTLGELAVFDANEDGILTADEVQLYAVNAVSGSESSDLRRLFRDDNGNGVWDAASEVALEATFEQLAGLDQSSMAVAGTIFAVFDDDGDGVLNATEATNLSFELIGTRVPLTLLPTEVTGGVPGKVADFVFADANGNGVYDVGEPSVTPDEYGIYTFLTGSDAAPTTSLGRLAPFDTNGNGRIDPSEGVFVVIGGTDTDNGVTNPVAATGVATNYGGGIEQTINPLTSLQVALVDRGLSSDAAADLVADAFNLPLGVDVDSFDPNADTAGDAAAEGAALGAGAMVTSLVTGGAGLLGDDANADLQDAVLDQLADVLIADANDGDGVVDLDLTDAQTVATVIVGAGSRAGRNVDATVANAAATVLTNVNRNIAETVAAGGDVDRALAANKAVFLNNVNDALTNLGNGTASASDLENEFSDEALDALQNEVELLPTIAPTMAELSDQVALGADVARITLTVADADSRASELAFTVTSSDEAIVSAADVTFEYNNGEWTMLVPTAVTAAGATVLSVTVSDGDATASTTFTLSLDGLNPVVQAIANVPSQTLFAGQTTTLDLADYFDDPNGDATYTLVAVGANDTVDAAIVNGQVVLTARTDLSGLAIFDLVATDANGTASTRFSVVTYPDVLVSDEVRTTADGRIEIDVTLSNPATQSLTLRYNLSSNAPDAAGPLSGRLTFAPGETTKTLSFDLVASGLGDVRVNELAFGVSGSWVQGTYAVDIDNRNPVELFDLQRRAHLRVAIAYDFVIIAAQANEGGWAEVFAPAAADPAVVVLGQTASVTAAAAAGATPDLVAATSLAGLETPRALRGL